MNDKQKINESIIDRITLKPQKPRSLAKCHINGFVCELLMCEDNVYISEEKIITGGSCKDSGVEISTIITIPEKSVKHFRYVSYILLIFHRNLFSIMENKHIDKINFDEIKKNLELEYGYSYLVKVMLGYSVNEYFMKYAPKPMISAIFKTAERMYGLYNHYEREADKEILLINSVNKEKQNYFSKTVSKCPLYSQCDNDEKIAFCPNELTEEEKNSYTTYNGIKFCTWHYSEIYAMKDQYSHSWDARFIKIQLQFYKSIDKYIDKIKKEYGSNNESMNKWIIYLNSK